LKIEVELDGSGTDFQYPPSDRAHCNHVLYVRADEDIAPFSILHRIEPTVTEVRQGQTQAIKCFQYPPSDRAHCNAYRNARRALENASFSILHRIEPTVTCIGCSMRSFWSIFQYPPSDRAHCNRLREWREWLVERDFQYPPSDRAHCNISEARRGQSMAHTFSILHRIEPTVTVGRSRATTYLWELSVSSIGSSPL